MKKMDIYDWQRLYTESTERFTAVYQTLANVVLNSVFPLSTYDDDFVKEIGMELLTAKEEADFQIQQIHQLVETMTIL